DIMAPQTNRKDLHLDAVLHHDMSMKHKTAGFESVEFEHCALPGIQLYPSDWIIRGNVDVLRGSNMSSQRLAQFYLKACGASHDELEDWYCLRLADYRPLKKLKKLKK
ncbi:hypothetical protein P7M49_24125, partial [Vibrio parahaemolyticus]|nr:hypothetical protein [Vibrio parahaemolyticus]